MADRRLFAGGLLLSPAGLERADVLSDGGTVAAVLRAGERVAGAEVVDCQGLWVMPGAIDAHVHSRDPGFPAKEDFDSLTAAAAAGGVTTVIDMPNTVPAADSAAALERKARSAAQRARVDFALYGLIRASTPPEAVREMASLSVAFKAYLGYAFHRGRGQVLYTPGSEDAALEEPPSYSTLERLAASVPPAVPVAVHCEDPEMLIAAARPVSGYEDILASRPEAAEARAVEAVGEIGRRTGLHVHAVHLSSAAGVRAGREAKQAGAPLTMETCPQYLWRTAGDAAAVGPVMKMFPPVRREQDREALRNGLFNGDIDIVGTDHAPHTDEEKLTRSWEDAAAGSPGVQTLLVSCLALASAAGRPEMAVTWLCAGPARIFGLGGRKGSLEPGSDADLVLVDPRGRTSAGPETALSRQRHGALDGIEFPFAIRATYVRGRLAAKDGAPVSGPGSGRLVTR